MKLCFPSALVASAIALTAVLASCAADAVDPDLGAVSGACASDLGCPHGEECGALSCQALAPGLYPHIQTASILFRYHSDAEEVAWRAGHFDLLIARVNEHVDEFRAVNPNVRLFEYMYARYHNYDDFGNRATDWAVANGHDPEDFYLHYREDVAVPTWEGTVLVDGFPAGVIPGWNPDAGPGDPPASASSREEARVVGYRGGATTTSDPWCMGNINNQAYRDFLLYWASSVLDGSLNNRSFGGGPIDGIVFDNAIYYPQFGEGMLEKTEEYYGIEMNDQHPHALGFATLYPEITAGLAGHFGRAADVMPNYGHVVFLTHTDEAARAVVENTPWILAEVWLTHFAYSSPTKGSLRTITHDVDYRNAIRPVIEQTRGSRRRVLGAQDLSNSSFGTDRGKLFTLALYYLVHNANTYYVYETVSHHNNSLHLSRWSWNPAVEFDVGQPDQIPAGATDYAGTYPSNEHWVFASGADPHRNDLTYHVLARRFTNALVLAKMLPAGSVIDNRSITTHALDGSYAVLQADGTLGEVVTYASLRNNEGLILIPVD
jgi:hypothetical protein